MLKSEANYIRLCRMCIDVGIGLLRDVLQQYIDSLYPYTTLKEFLRANKKKMIGFASADKVIGTRYVCSLKSMTHILLM
ncbi:hypothetical protein DPMN_182161 [Dreissena polymorpha]|uniref:Uncharacterized protein n=1 Tax=Dreissena polymorpha TaxID=45954 RepID=A0A9D4I5X3_DREPO|nr:hypothetical protein DPMN_182161 [Dreissena polymorpha]